jgi:hypothetical protein
MRVSQMISWRRHLRLNSFQSTYLTVLTRPITELPSDMRIVNVAQLYSLIYPADSTIGEGLS